MRIARLVLGSLVALCLVGSVSWAETATKTVTPVAPEAAPVAAETPAPVAKPKHKRGKKAVGSTSAKTVAPAVDAVAK
jgi:hypothetical protein